MRRRHLRAVAEIDAKVYPRPWSLALYRAEIAQPESRQLYVVAKVGREIVGHAGLIFAAGDAHVTTIAVEPRRQRHGIGTRLLLVLLRAGLQRGATAFTLEVRAGNHTAQNLYRRFGFVEAGVRAGYYPEHNEDAVIMWAHGVATDAYRVVLDQVEAGLSGPPPIDQVCMSSSVRASRGGVRS
jgi:[ribosomal protein S18]-alanine N-acetyltransferase